MRRGSLTDEKIVQLKQMSHDGLSNREIGRRLRVDHVTVANYLTREEEGVGAGEAPPAKIGEVIDRTAVDGTIDFVRMERPATVEELMRACKLDPAVWIPEYYKPNTWQGFAKMKVGESEHLQKVALYQSKLVVKRIIPDEIEKAIGEWIRKSVHPLPKPTLKAAQASRHDEPGQMVSWGFWDAHLGAYAWASEVGKNWDVQIACNRIYNSVDDMAVELAKYKIGRIIMPVGNDFLHFDNLQRRTTSESHQLDADSRYQRVYEAGLTCLAYQVDRALDLSGDLEIKYIPGNHDYIASFALCSALAQRYRNDPRVKVDLGANSRKYVVWGGTLLWFDHGAGVTPQQLALIIPTEARDVWSKITYCEAQQGHKHQRWEKQYQGVTPTNGILVVRNPSLANVDAWHHQQGFIGEPMKSVEARRYDHVGYRGSHVAWARDDSHPRVKAALAAIQ